MSADDVREFLDRGQRIQAVDRAVGALPPDELLLMLRARPDLIRDVQAYRRVIRAARAMVEAFRNGGNRVIALGELEAALEAL